MEDILDDPGYRNLGAGDKVAWLDLLAIFNRQQAHRTGNMIVLAWSRAFDALASRNRRAALTKASRLARGVGAHFARVPEGLLCFIPNWAKSQNLAPTQLRCVSVAIPSTTPTPTTTPRKKEPAAPAAPVSGPLAGAPKRKKRAAKTPFPEPFPRDLRDRLYAWAPGAKFSREQVDASIIRVGDWAVPKGTLMVDWARAIMGYMRDGWPLKNYHPPLSAHVPRQSENWDEPGAEPAEADVLELKASIAQRRKERA